MPATTLDSMIFRDIFTTPEMRQVFSDENRTACYLEIEAALARVQGRLGIIPPAAAREIDSKCRIENLDFAKLKATTERIGYPILGVVQQIVQFCDKGLGEWCHWGATTQDITDTVAIMQIRAICATGATCGEARPVSGSLPDVRTGTSPTRPLGRRGRRRAPAPS